MTSDDHFEFAKSVNEQTINSSNVVLRSLLVIHGGSAIALLAFVGSIAGQDALDIAPLIVGLSKPLTLFGWGVAMTVLAMIMAYFTNFFTVGHAFESADTKAECGYRWSKGICHLIAILVTFGSLALFVWGIYEVRNAILLIAH